MYSESCEGKQILDPQLYDIFLAIRVAAYRSYLVQ